VRKLKRKNISHIGKSFDIESSITIEGDSVVFVAYDTKKDREIMKKLLKKK